MRNLNRSALIATAWLVLASLLGLSSPATAGQCPTWQWLQKFNAI